MKLAPNPFYRRARQSVRQHPSWQQASKLGSMFNAFKYISMSVSSRPFSTSPDLSNI